MRREPGQDAPDGRSRLVTILMIALLAGALLLAALYAGQEHPPPATPAIELQPGEAADIPLPLPRGWAELRQAETGPFEALAVYAHPATARRLVVGRWERRRPERPEKVARAALELITGASAEHLAGLGTRRSRHGTLVAATLAGGGEGRRLLCTAATVTGRRWLVVVLLAPGAPRGATDPFRGDRKLLAKILDGARLAPPEAPPEAPRSAIRTIVAETGPPTIALLRYRTGPRPPAGDPELAPGRLLAAFARVHPADPAGEPARTTVAGRAAWSLDWPATGDAPLRCRSWIVPRDHDLLILETAWEPGSEPDWDPLMARLFAEVGSAAPGAPALSREGGERIASAALEQFRARFEPATRHHLIEHAGRPVAWEVVRRWRNRGTTPWPLRAAGRIGTGPQQEVETTSWAAAPDGRTFIYAREGGGEEAAKTLARIRRRGERLTGLRARGEAGERWEITVPEPYLPPMAASTWPWPLPYDAGPALLWMHLGTGPPVACAVRAERGPRRLRWRPLAALRENRMRLDARGEVIESTWWQREAEARMPVQLSSRRVSAKALLRAFPEARPHTESLRTDPDPEPP